MVKHDDPFDPMKYLSQHPYSSKEIKGNNWVEKGGGVIESGI